jgi:hypothetical protein
LYWNLSTPPLQNEDKNAQLSIVRNFDTPEEERALTAAESVNYANIMQKELYNGSTYTTFIDTEVVNYYQKLYEHQEKQTNPKGVTLNYMANATKLASVSVFNSPGGTKLNYQNETIPWHNNTVVFYDIGNSALLATARFSGDTQHNNPYTRVFYKSQSEYRVLQPEFNLTFSNCYFIEMKFQYSEYYAPLAASWYDVHQIVILDQNLVPVLISIHTSLMMS